MSRPLILTLKLDADSFAMLDGLRRRYFPADRNVVPAHVTLFHALPGGEGERLVRDLNREVSRHSAFDLSYPSLRFLGRGVAINVLGDGLLTLRQRLAELWRPCLGAQDRAGYRPHVTIQNKVAAGEARALFASLSEGWRSFDGRAEGLLLWRYLGGPWGSVAEFVFR